jgi:5-methylcytosine-specific restriction endonuclease McrA
VTDRFYSSTAWKRTRAAVRARDGGCVVCGTTTGPLDVDHVIPWAQRPDLAYDPANLRTLCRLHHNRKTARGRTKTKRRNTRNW